MLVIMLVKTNPPSVKADYGPDLNIQPLGYNVVDPGTQHFGFQRVKPLLHVQL